MKYQVYFRVIRQADGWGKKFDRDYMRVYPMDADGEIDYSSGPDGVRLEDIGEEEWEQISKKIYKMMDDCDPHAWDVDVDDYTIIRTVDPGASAMAKKRWANTTPEERTAYAKRIASRPRRKN